MHAFSKVIVIGLDGLEPTIVEPMLSAGTLPNLAKVRSQGAYARIATTYPAQTPVAWSSFATGVNPGGHGIFDFIHRDPKTYLPNLSFNRYEQKNAFVAPRAVNLRRGAAVWEVLAAAGVSSTVLRCPCTYPPDNARGRMLAGMGVPDLRGSLGVSTFYTTDENVKAQESESVVAVQWTGGSIATQILGPRKPKTKDHFTCAMTLQGEAGGKKLMLKSDGQPNVLELREGQWSPWLKVKFKTGLLQSVRGMVRFYLVRTAPVFELYASPINFDPDSPLFPISSPPTYAKELAARIGTFYTTGMVEDHGGLNNGRIDENAFLDQCEQVLRERERMMLHELERLQEGLFYCLFDTPDRVQHMLWRFREKDHPANRGRPPLDLDNAIEENYQACDAIVGKALRFADEKTLVIVLSDHGFNSFRRGIHVNTWLHENGLLTLKDGTKPGEEAGDFFHNVDWGRTKAYALGLGSIYLNQKGREGQGIVEPKEAPALGAAIAQGLAGLVDPDRGQTAVQRVMTREQIYHGPCSAEGPDLVVNCAAGYRASWGTALGGVAAGLFEDNVKPWSGDHIIDPALVPGVLFMNRAFAAEGPRLLDMAPTILKAFGVPPGKAMEGRSLLL